MDRENPSSDVGVLRSRYVDTIDWDVRSFMEPLTIYCSVEAAPRIRAMLYDAYVDNYGCPPELAREYIYGPPEPEPYRPNPARVAVLFEEAPAQEALRRMGRSLAESVAVIEHVGSSGAAIWQAMSQQLIVEQKVLTKVRLYQRVFEEYGSFKLADFDQLARLASPVYSSLPDAVKPQKQRGKGRRGHNSDRDRVIGGKAEYC